jgi:hypothetical protein
VTRTWSDWAWVIVGVVGTLALGGLALSSCSSFLGHQQQSNTSFLTFVATYVWTWLWTRPFVKFKTR